MEDPAAFALDDEETVQDPERCRRHGEKSKATIASRWLWRNASHFLPHAIGATAEVEKRMPFFRG
jgi:hypothetical protein